MASIRRYLGNARSGMLHDTLHEHANCRLERIGDAQKRWYHTVGDARGERAYFMCTWCLAGRRGLTPGRRGLAPGGGVRVGDRPEPSLSRPV